MLIYRNSADCLNMKYKSNTPLKKLKSKTPLKKKSKSKTHLKKKIVRVKQPP